MSESILNKSYYLDLESIHLDDSLDTYHTTLVKMSNDFKIWLKETYQRNKRWTRVLNVISKIENLTFERLRFVLRNDLIYYVDDLNDRERLCILKALRKKIFHLAHDEQSHSEFHRIYDQLIVFVYIRKLF